MQITPTHRPDLSRTTGCSMKSRIPGVEWHDWCSRQQRWYGGNVELVQNIVLFTGHFSLIDGKIKTCKGQMHNKERTINNHCDLHWHIVLLQEDH